VKVIGKHDDLIIHHIFNENDKSHLLTTISHF